MFQYCTVYNICQYKEKQVNVGAKKNEKNERFPFIIAYFVSLFQKYINSLWPEIPTLKFSNPSQTICEKKPPETLKMQILLIKSLGRQHGSNYSEFNIAAILCMQNIKLETPI